MSVFVSVSVVIVLQLSALMIIDSAKLKCKGGYRQHQDRCIKLFGGTNDQRPWLQARDRCRKDGGDLAFIESAQTQKFIAEVLALNEDVEEAWFGLNDRIEEGRYTYPNGLRNTYNGAWVNDQGPNSTKDGNGQDCVMIVIKQDGKNWYDENCAMPYNFLCELPRRPQVTYSDPTSHSPTELNTNEMPSAMALSRTTTILPDSTSQQKESKSQYLSTSEHITPSELSTSTSEYYMSTKWRNHESNHSQTTMAATVLTSPTPSTVQDIPTTSVHPTNDSQTPCSTRPSNITLAPTGYHSTEMNKCKNGHVGGIISKCGPDGRWVSSEIVQCRLFELDDIHREILRKEKTLTITDIVRLSSETRQLVSNTSLVWHNGDVLTVKAILEDMLSRMTAMDEAVLCDPWLGLSQLLVDITSIILDVKHKEKWLEIQKDSPNVMGISTLVDEIGFLTNRCSYLFSADGKPTVKELKSENLRILAVQLPNQSNPFTMKFTNDASRVVFQPTVFVGQDGKIRPTSLVSVMYRTLHVLNTENKLLRNGDSHEVNSHVTSASVRPPLWQDHQNIVSITMEHIQVDNRTDPICGFWNFSAEFTNTTSWSTHGCRVETTNNSYTRCICNHLTNFAILMQTVHFEIPYSDTVALSVITYVGCGLSICGLLCTFVVLLSLGHLRNERTDILMNLSAALLLAQVVFLLGTHQTENKLLCRIIAIVLHLLFLTSFMWMLVEAIQLWLKVVCVFTKRNRTRYFFVAAWGIPLIITGISVAFNYAGYGTEKYCWLQISNGFIWAFTGPALAIIIANVTVLAIVLKSYLSLKAASKKTKIQKTGSAIRASVILFPILGTTWIFGFFAVDNNTMVFQYIFAVLNSLQGLLIFLFHCVGNEDVKNKYIKRRKPQRTANVFNNRVFPGGVHTHAGTSVDNRQDTNSPINRRLAIGDN